MQQSDASLYLPDEAATAALAAAVAFAIDSERSSISSTGLNIFLSGDLGTGKTALVRGLLRSLGVAGPIKSPTYALVEPYVVSSLDFYHFDFYRIANPAEIESAGFRDLFGPGRVCIVEWPERGGDRVPAADIALALQVDGNGRRAALRANTELGAACLRHAMNNMKVPQNPDAGGC